MKYIGRLSLLAMVAVVSVGCVNGADRLVTDQVVGGQEAAGGTGKVMNERMMGREMGGYTLAEVAKHNGAGDCWMVIDGRVEDVTEFVVSHPGGETILMGCGTDATELFNTRSMGSGTPHSDGARGQLLQYEIGRLIDR